MHKILVFLVLFNFIVPSTLFAKTDPLHQSLDRQYRFSKKWQSEIGPFGGDYLGDETHNSWAAGGHYYLHLNNTFALGVSYAYTPVYTDWASAFGASLTTRRQHMIDGELMISNDAAFRIGDEIVKCDLYFTLGGGTIQINHSFQPMIVIGGGLKVYTGIPWLAFRMDVNSYMHTTPNPTGDTFNADIGMLLGVSFLFPRNLR